MSLLTVEESILLGEVTRQSSKEQRNEEMSSHVCLSLDTRYHTRCVRTQCEA